MPLLTSKFIDVRAQRDIRAVKSGQHTKPSWSSTSFLIEKKHDEGPNLQVWKNLVPFSYQEIFRVWLSRARATQRAARRRCGDVVTLVMDDSDQTLAPVRCQDHRQGRRVRPRLGAFLTVAAVASVLRDRER